MYLEEWAPSPEYSSSEEDPSPVEHLRVAWKNPILESPGPFFMSFCICASISMLCKLTNFCGKENFRRSKPGNFLLMSVGPSNWIEGCWGCWGCGWKRKRIQCNVKIKCNWLSFVRNRTFEVRGDFCLRYHCLICKNIQYFVGYYCLVILDHCLAKSVSLITDLIWKLAWTMLNADDWWWAKSYSQFRLQSS